jgi:hypothetical protein
MTTTTKAAHTPGAGYDPTVPDRKPRLTTDTIHTAIAWLECNEGTDGEAEACQTVADWLKSELNRRAVREVSITLGVPIAKARAAIAKCSGDRK